MKTIFYCILLFLLLPAFIFAQGPPIEEGLENRENQPFSGWDSIQPDTSGILHSRMTWKWVHDGIYRELIPLDTLVDKLHNYHPIFKRSIANSYLANLPSAYEPDIFIDRPQMEDFSPLTTLRAYLYKPSDALEFTTTTPYTLLTYFTGGGKGAAENYLDVWHTQNIKPYWNAGFRYNLVSGDGRYMNQKSKTYNLSLFSSYDKERVAVSFFINQNTSHLGENGGISNKEDLNNKDIEPENIPTFLSDVMNTVRNFNFKTTFQYNIGAQKVTHCAQDTIVAQDSVVSYPLKAVLTMEAEDNQRRFKENIVNGDYFPVSYFDSVRNTDILKEFSFAGSGKLVMNEHPKYAYLPGIYAGIDFKYQHYNDRAPSIDTNIVFQKTVYNSTWLNGGIFNVDTAALLNFDVNTRICLVGDYIGDFSLSGYIRQYFNKERTSYFNLDASFSSKTVNHHFNYYYGNHNQWSNHFSKTEQINIKGKYVNTGLRSEIGVGVNSLIDHIYMDDSIRPVQSSKPVIVMTAWGKQTFRLGHFYFEQQAYIQKSSHENALSLPVATVYSHNYYENRLFKKVLLLAIGFDFFYNTKYYADRYDPATMSFYRQQSEKTGHYPKVDVFVNFKLKRADMFVKYEHLNYYVSNKESFTTVNYPINPPMLKFGVRWNFFD